jgi:hypothetical protein
MRWIYISPHFDDAVLSCGGLIWEQTQADIPVEIWTINAGDPPLGAVSDLITRVHAMWKTGSPQDTVRLRRIEDQNAAKQVGAILIHYPMVDAIYRRSSLGDFFYKQDVFDPIHPSEIGIVEEVAKLLKFNIVASDAIVCPLALGGHVDHVIARKAIESLGCNIWYYADIPYLFRHTDELELATSGMNAEIYSISDNGLLAWQKSIAAHNSQIPSLFTDMDDMQNKIQEYKKSGNGFSLWHQV